jgi:hypothetical protein
MSERYYTKVIRNSPYSWRRLNVPPEKGHEPGELHELELTTSENRYCGTEDLESNEELIILVD